MKKLIFIFACMPVYAATCPSGMIAVEYDTFVPAVAGACDAGYVGHDTVSVCGADDGACWIIEQIRALCTAGITALNTSGGLSFPLYSDKSTSPSLHILYNNTVCYADAASGVATDTINIQVPDGAIYHLVK